jgi:plastocyanin
MPRCLPVILLLFVTGLVPAGALRAAGAVQVVIKDDKGQPVADAVASLTLVDAPAPAVVPPAEPVVIQQQNEEFSPYVTPIVVGTKVSFPNYDKVQHHVYSLSKAKKFELPLYSGEARELVVFDRPGVVALGCNIHDWMVAYVVVLATPYFEKTGAAGTATLTRMPAGRYRLEVWHPRLVAAVDRDVTINANDDATQVVSVTLKPDRRIRRAPDAGGGGYK